MIFELGEFSCIMTKNHLDSLFQSINYCRNKSTDMYMKFKVKLAPIDLIACALYTKQHYFVYPSLMRKQTIVDRANHMA